MKQPKEGYQLMMRVMENHQDCADKHKQKFNLGQTTKHATKTAVVRQHMSDKHLFKTKSQRQIAENIKRILK